jgi:hypothetical protein
MTRVEEGEKSVSFAKLKAARFSLLELQEAAALSTLANPVSTLWTQKRVILSDFKPPGFLGVWP